MKVSWPKVRLGEVLQRSDEVVLPTADTQYREITVRLWGRGVIERGRVDGASLPGTRRYLARSGQFIVSRIDARNGAMGIVPDELDGAVVTNDFPLFDLHTDRLVPSYLGWLSRTQDFVALCQRASEGTTNRVRLQEARFLALDTPLPPLAEQRQVVARIEELAIQINEARTLRTQALNVAEALLTSATTALCGHDLHWATVRDVVLKHKGAVRSGPFGSQLLHEEFVESGILAIGTRDVQTDRFELNSGWCVRPETFAELRRYQVFPGDILCTIVGASIGRFCVVPNGIPLAFTTKHIQALTLDAAVADSQFVSYMLNFHQRCRESLLSQIEGSAQPSLNANKVLATELPLPSLREQHRIMATLDALRAEVDVLRGLQAETAANLAALLPAILHCAFKGEL